MWRRGKEHTATVFDKIRRQDVGQEGEESTEQGVLKQMTAIAANGVHHM